jgi:hypothetical protein
MLRLALLLGSFWLGGCTRSGVAAAPVEVVFRGACDASAAVPLSGRTMLVADDEDNVLRSYDAELGGEPLSQLDVSSFLGLPFKKKGAPEIDVEGAARIGDRAYFITSHGRNSAGKLKPERLRFFATTAPSHGAPEPIGRPYDRLLSDLLAAPQLAAFGLAAAAELPPKAAGGLNIEGMTARAEGGVWLGFRNPLPQGRALLVPLSNPEELVNGGRARFGEPVTLALSGLGVRALASFRGGYLIAAGPFAAGGASRLFAWDGKTEPRELSGMDVRRYNPEAFFVDGERVLLLSDDGSRVVEGVECKQVSEPALKRFRGIWLTPR